MNQVPIVVDYFRLEADFQHFLAYSNYGELTEEETTRLRNAYMHGGDYDSVSQFGYDLAVRALKNGHKVAREGWKGKNMFLFLVKERSSRAYEFPLNTMVEAGAIVKRRAYIAMRTADGEVVPWHATQSDMLEQDWFILQS